MVGALVTSASCVTSKEEQGNAVFAVHYMFNQLYITNKMEGFNFISGHAVRVAELIKEDWPIVLQ